MLFIYDTVSLCDKCYRHIPAFVFEKNESIYLKKKCPFHGESEILIEPDAKLFHSLTYKPNNNYFVLFELTDKCQLECPHCYHLPDNKVQDKSVEEVLEHIKKLPQDSRLIMAGAEPSLHSNFVEVVRSIKNLDYFKTDKLSILTNAVKFSSNLFAKKAVNAGLNRALIGLNHYTYNGKAAHQQQIKGLKNLIDNNCKIGYLGYTVESLDHIPDIMDEIEQLSKYPIDHFRIRCGSFIGRSSDSQRSYISDTIKSIENYVGKENISLIPDTDHNIYHINIMWRGIYIRVIQWPDVANINMEELNMSPFGQVYGKPITNFVHQVILRDAYKNMSLPVYDGVPYKYSYYGDKTYWRNNFTGMIEINDYDYKSNKLLSNRLPRF